MKRTVEYELKEGVEMTPEIQKYLDEASEIMSAYLDSDEGKEAITKMLYNLVVFGKTPV